MKEIKIKDKIIGDNQPVFIVAEMACTHDGSMEIAKRIIEAACDAKADAINFQMTSLSDWMVPDYNVGGVSAGKDKSDIYGYLEKIYSFSEKDWEELFDYARVKGLIISATVNDLPSARLAVRLNLDIYQIHSSALSEKNLVKEVAKIKKPICLKIGGTFLGEIERVISWIKEEDNDQIMLLHGFQSYPTKLENVNLKFIHSLKRLFALPVGFADHTDGGTEFALTVPLLALAFGANFIETHLTHDRTKQCEDFESALNPEDFERFVQNVREIEKTFGQEAAHIFSKDELEYRNVSKKRIVAKQDIKEGEEIIEDKICFKRANDGLLPDIAEYLIGRITNKEIKANDPITWDKIK